MALGKRFGPVGRFDVFLQPHASLVSQRAEENRIARERHIMREQKVGAYEIFVSFSKLGFEVRVVSIVGVPTVPHQRLLFRSTSGRHLPISFIEIERSPVRYLPKVDRGARGLPLADASARGLADASRLGGSGFPRFVGISWLTATASNSLGRFSEGVEIVVRVRAVSSSTWTIAAQVA
jgi:hypothetical protein